jgi:flagellar biogenesis protein FliO
MIFELLISPETTAMVGRSPLVTVGYIFQLLISMAIVIGLIYFSAKYVLPKIQLPSTGKMIEIKDRIGLEPQVSAYVISALGKTYLIAVSAKGVTLLDSFEEGAGPL